MKFSPALALALLTSLAVGQQTVTVPSYTITIPAQTISVPAQTLPVVTASTPVTPTPPVTTTQKGATVYQNGVFSWAGDWNSSLLTNYADTSVNAAGAIKATSTGQWAIWLPYAPPQGPPYTPGNATLTPSFNTTGYSTLSLQIYPTVASQTWSLAIYKYTTAAGVTTGDIVVGTVQNIQQYCTPFAVKAWMTCNVPLSAMNATNLTTLYKFGLQDQSGLTGDVFYVNNVYFK